MARVGKGKVVPLWETPNGRGNGGGIKPSSEPLRTTLAAGPRPFPVVTTLPRLPVMIPDEILDYYGWVFCQGGFLNLHMTFEQFLTVVAAVSPSGLCPEYDESNAVHTSD